MTHPDDVPGAHVSQRWAQWRQDVSLAEYHARWEQMEASGTNSHGEADFISGYSPEVVLDAGCGAGRNLVYLLRRGFDVWGTDADARAFERQILARFDNTNSPPVVQIIVRGARARLAVPVGK